MNSNNSIQIVLGLRLVIVAHRNILSQDGVSEIFYGMLQNPYFQSDFFVIIDLRNAEILMDPDEIEETSILVNKQLSQTGLKKLAIITKTPTQYSKANEFVRFFKDSKNYQVCTSLDEALHWLSIPMERKEQIKVRLEWMNKQEQLN